MISPIIISVLSFIPLHAVNELTAYTEPVPQPPKEIIVNTVASIMPRRHRFTENYGPDKKSKRGHTKTPNKKRFRLRKKSR